MSKDLIVVAAHGSEYIDKCIQSLSGDVLVIDTGAGNVPGADVVMPFMGYATGAYLWAYWHYPADNYFFMQDSLQAIDPDFLKAFKDILPERGAVGWSSFPLVMDNQAQDNFIRYCYEATPEFGIFGPIFYISRSSLDELRDKKLLPPTPMNKNHDMACERMWSMAIAQAGMDLVFAEPDYIKHVVQGQSMLFNKTFANRS